MDVARLTFYVRPVARRRVLVAFDDTDGPGGGCTTRLVLDVLAATGLAPRGLPRLVRLNPNVPWKTRGNAAVCVELVEPEGVHTRIGEWRGMEVHAYPDGPEPRHPDAAFDAAVAAIEAQAQPDARCGVAAVTELLPAALYWQAVQTLVRPDDAAALLSSGAAANPRAHARDPRALVGCAAALAWPGPPSSFEWIAYREPARIGTRRDVWRPPLAHLDAHGAFHSWDSEVRRPACVPNTPCPVLLGIRGRDPEALVHGAVETTRRAAREPVDAWLLWATNQASGDHVVAVERLADAPERATVEVAATVRHDAAWQGGGQVEVGLADAAGAPFAAVAFPPTGRFRHTVAALAAGDEVRVVGAWRDGIVRLEKLHVLHASRRAPPPVCHGTMKRKGRTATDGTATFKCRTCGRTATQPDRAPDDARVGAFEVAVRARRHLHRPLAWTEGVASGPIAA